MHIDSKCLLILQHSQSHPASALFLATRLFMTYFELFISYLLSVYLASVAIVFMAAPDKANLLWLKPPSSSVKSILPYLLRVLRAYIDSSQHSF